MLHWNSKGSEKSHPNSFGINTCNENKGEIMSTDVIRIGNRLIGVDELVDSRTAARITGLSERTIRDKAVRREFRIYKLAANCTKYCVSDLLNWCSAKVVEPADQYRHAA